MTFPPRPPGPSATTRPKRTPPPQPQVPPQAAQQAAVPAPAPAPQAPVGEPPPHSLADLRLDPKEVESMKKMFSEGYTEFHKNPEKYLTEKRLREDQTKPFAHKEHEPLLALPTLPGAKDEEAGKAAPGMAKAFYDYTQPIAEHEEALYERVKKLAMRRGYEASDFELGGSLFGWSANEILDLLGGDRGSENT